jgi:hypothetical protein
MQTVQYFCDICGKECLGSDGLGTFVGFIVKMNANLKPERIGFEGHHCSECVEKLLNFISELKSKIHDV